MIHYNWGKCYKKKDQTEYPWFLCEKDESSLIQAFFIEFLNVEHWALVENIQPHKFQPSLLALLEFTRSWENKTPIQGTPVKGPSEVL